MKNSTKVMMPINTVHSNDASSTECLIFFNVADLAVQQDNSLLTEPSRISSFNAFFPFDKVGTSALAMSQCGSINYHPVTTKVATSPVYHPVWSRLRSAAYMEAEKQARFFSERAMSLDETMFL